MAATAAVAAAGAAATGAAEAEAFLEAFLGAASAATAEAEATTEGVAEAEAAEGAATAGLEVAFLATFFTEASATLAFIVILWLDVLVEDILTQLMPRKGGYGVVNFLPDAFNFPPLFRGSLFFF